MYLIVQKNRPRESGACEGENYFAGLAEFLVTVAGFVGQLDLDAHETVVLGDTVRAAEGTGLDLAAVGSDGDVGDGELNFSVRNGKRWFLTAITTAVCYLREYFRVTVNR